MSTGGIRNQTRNSRTLASCLRSAFWVFGWLTWLKCPVNSLRIFSSQDTPLIVLADLRFLEQNRFFQAFQKLVSFSVHRWLASLSLNSTSPSWAASFTALLPRDAMHKHGLHRHAVSVRPSVKFVRLSNFFSPSGSHAVLVFL